MAPVIRVVRACDLYSDLLPAVTGIAGLAQGHTTSACASPEMPVSSAAVAATRRTCCVCCGESCWVTRGRPQALRRSEINLLRKLRRHVEPTHVLWLFLRHAHRLVEDMNSFCQHLRAYVLLEVVEGAWADMLADVDKVRRPSPATPGCGDVIVPTSRECTFPGIHCPCPNARPSDTVLHHAHLNSVQRRFVCITQH